MHAPVSVVRVVEEGGIVVVCVRERSRREESGRGAGRQAETHLDVHLYVVCAVLLDNGENTEGEVDVVRDPIPHELKLAIRRDERDRAIRLKLQIIIIIIIRAK